eukprot:10141-Heterococcus_DN1.PRE.1
MAIAPVWLNWLQQCVALPTYAFKSISSSDVISSRLLLYQISSCYSVHTADCACPLLLCYLPACVQGAHEPLCLELTQDLLVSGWRDGIIRAHDADSGALLWQIDDAHSGGVTALTLSGNQRFALTEKQVSHHSQRMGGVNGVALSRDQAT